MKIHPYAELFPPLDRTALQKLADDIAKNGLRQPVWTLDGQILDGRNRWTACLLVGVECQTIEYAGDDPLGFVISLNLHRRQLTPSQLAMVGVEIEALRAKAAECRKVEKCRTLASEQSRDAAGRLGQRSSRVPQKIGGPGRLAESARQTAKEIGVNHDYISKAKRVALVAPELVPLVKAGELKLQDAATLAKMAEPQRNLVLANLESVRDIRKAIAKVAVEAPNTAGDLPKERWTESEALARLRSCFSEVLGEYAKYANGDFASLLGLTNDLLSEVELEWKRWPPNGTSRTRGWPQI